MTRTACIIPVVGNSEGLETTLLSVLERRPDDCEVLVVLNTPYADPYNLRDEIRFLQAPPTAGLVACINLGIAATKAPLVHLLSKGFEADNGWIEAATAHFENPCVAAVTPLIHDAADHVRLLAAGVAFDRAGRRTVCNEFAHSAMQGSNAVGPSIQAAFYRTAALETFGGGLPKCVGDRLADVDLALSLRKAGWETVVEPKCRVFAASLDDELPTGFRSGLWAERFFWRHINEDRALRRLLAHPWATLVDLARAPSWWNAPVQLLGRFLALCQLGHYREYRQALSAAQAAAAEAQSRLAMPSEPVAVEPVAPHSDAQHRLDPPHPATRKLETGAARSSRRRRSRR